MRKSNSVRLRFMSFIHYITALLVNSKTSIDRLNVKRANLFVYSPSPESTSLLLLLLLLLLHNLGVLLPFGSPGVVSNVDLCIRLMELTLGTELRSQTPSFRSLSLISQLKMPGFSLLYSSTFRSTSSVATRGLLPPIAPGRMLPVSW